MCLNSENVTAFWGIQTFVFQQALWQSTAQRTEIPHRCCEMNHYCNHFWAGKWKLRLVQSEELQDHASNQDEFDKTWFSLPKVLTKSFYLPPRKFLNNVNIEITPRLPCHVFSQVFFLPLSFALLTKAHLVY